MSAFAPPQPLRRADLRVRTRRALATGVVTLAVLLCAATLVAFAWRLGRIERLWILPLSAVALGVLTNAVGFAFMRRVDPLFLAHRLDTHFGWKDRLRSALVFGAQTERTPFMDAAIFDAERICKDVDLRPAFPVAPPRRSFALVGVSALACLAVIFVRLPEPKRPALVPTAPAAPKLAVPEDAIAPEKRDVEKLLAEARASADPDTQKKIEALNKLLEQIAAGEMTRKDAFDKLAELEKQLQAGRPDGEGVAALERAMKRAGEEMQKEKRTRELGQALAKEDLDAARRELEALAKEAERLASEKEKNADRDAIARSLDKSAAASQRDSQEMKEQQKRDQEERRLKEEERRLKKEQQERPNDQDVQRRLQKNKRELERLERDKKQANERRRELQRLQRELERAAEELRQKLSPEAMKQLEEHMKEMQNEIKKLDLSKRTQIQISEIEEMLRRMAEQKKNGQGQDGKGQGKSQAQREFERRAGTKQQLTLGGDGQDGTLILPMPGKTGEGQAQPGQGGDPQDPKPGDQAGTGHDPNLLGDKTRLDARHRDTRVTGKEGQGPSRSETILSSAEKGFASSSYKRVFQDYTSVMEEVMTKERVPPGYRAYVKRYFELIKPRE